MSAILLAGILFATAATTDAASYAAPAVAGEAAEPTMEELVAEAAKTAAKAAVDASVKDAVEQAAADVAKRLADEKSEKEERREAAQRIETRMFRLSHASSAEVADKLNNMWNGEFGQVWKVTRMAVAFEEQNMVMVTAPRIILDACAKVIEELDIETQQVYIEARFVELGNTASHKVGIDWSMLDGMTGSATLGGGVRSTRLGQGVQNYTRTIESRGDKTSYSLVGGETTTGAGANLNKFMGGSDGDITYFNGTLDFSQMSLTLRALDATQDAKTFSNPKIIVASGKKAVVDMTTKYPNVKVAAKRTESSGSTSLDLASNLEAIPGEDKFMFAKEAFFSWGISLEVTPRISTNGLISVSIVPTISSQTDWVETGTTSDGESGSVSTKYPVIDVQRLVTEFKLESGSTAVIGGLSITKENQVDNGIPVLRSIPWVGQRLFGSMVRVKEQREIVVFVTVGLVNPREMPADAGLPKNAVLGRQYTKGQKLEPGDRPEKNMEGIDSLDLRLLEEQARDPLMQQPKQGFKIDNYIPFTKVSDDNKSQSEDQKQ